jgi:hypothetical protein
MLAQELLNKTKLHEEMMNLRSVHDITKKGNPFYEFKKEKLVKTFNTKANECDYCRFKMLEYLNLAWCSSMGDMDPVKTWNEKVSRKCIHIQSMAARENQYERVTSCNKW